MEKKWMVNIGPESEAWGCAEKFATKQEAIDYARQEAIEYGHSQYQVGVLSSAWPTAPGADLLLDYAYDKMWDGVGDIAEDWCAKAQKCEPDLERRLETMWEQWLTDNGLKEVANTVVTVSEHTVVEND